MGSRAPGRERPGWLAQQGRWLRAGERAAGQGVALAWIGATGAVCLLALALIAVLASFGLLLLPAGMAIGRHVPLVRRLDPVAAAAVAFGLVLLPGLRLTSVTVAVAIAALAAGGLLLIPALLLAIRWLADVIRQRAGQWCGVEIPAPYQPREAADTGLLGLYRWLLADPATWRDLLWLTVNAAVGWVLTLAPAALAGWGLFTLASLAATPDSVAGLWVPATGLDSTGWYVIHATGPATAVLPALLGTGIVLASLRTAPRLVQAYGRFTHAFLAPTQRARLALRTQQLADSRAAVVAAEAAELSRIERDLHDGAQARLVGVAMTLSAADKLFDADAAAARALLREARDSSTRALAELRDLVRGIRPPVLADRGLADAIRAVALDSPLPVEVVADLPGRPPRAAEAAAYFAVSELLANVAKHAAASRGWVDAWHQDGRLRIIVGDDGRGGADPARGSGLRGIEQRLAAFDGVLTVSSPLGGPTVATLELPCVLSSPKTSSS